MIDNKRYVCYVIHSYTDFDKRDKKGNIVPRWHYDVKKAEGIPSETLGRRYQQTDMGQW